MLYEVITNILANTEHEDEFIIAMTADAIGGIKA